MNHARSAVGDRLTFPCTKTVSLGGVLGSLLDAFAIGAGR